MSNFNEINIGDKAELIHTITDLDVEKFVDLTGDSNRIHVDIDFAKDTFVKKPVIHGMLGASFISTVIGTKLPGDGALWFSQSLEFLLPVRVGDKITIVAQVIKKYRRDKILEIQTDIFNQNNQKVTSGIAKVKLIEKIDYTEAIKKPLNLKIALIIGATGGIGKAVSLRLAKEGYDIALHYYNNKNAADEIKDLIIKLGQKCQIYSADIVNNIQMEQMIKEIIKYYTTITVCVNCATINVANNKFYLLGWEDMQKHFDSAIKGSFIAAKYILPIMKEQKYGKIINFTTQYIDGAPPAELISYVTAKYALAGFTKSLAVEYAQYGITVNMISPSMTDTNLIANIPEKTRLMTEAKTPLRRIAKPEDIAGAVSFLASESADFITGETIRINGGQIML